MMDIILGRPTGVGGNHAHQGSRVCHHVAIVLTLLRNTHSAVVEVSQLKMCVCLASRRQQDICAYAYMLYKMKAHGAVSARQFIARQVCLLAACNQGRTLMNACLLLTWKPSQVLHRGEFGAVVKNICNPASCRSMWHAEHSLFHIAPMVALHLQLLGGVVHVCTHSRRVTHINRLEAGMYLGW